MKILLWVFNLLLVFNFLVLTQNLHAEDIEMILSSTSFSDGKRIPVVYTRPAVGGQNISPPLKWSKVPEGAKSLALSVIDPHPAAGNWVHWIVVNIPAEVEGLPEGASGKSMPKNSRELINSFGKSGYGGPQPPSGTGDHPYVFTLYALNVENIDISENTSLSGFLEAIQGHILAESRLTGYFGR
jgi:Raf kinase inhibitor-like YbhB/YbcL family protein